MSSFGPGDVLRAKRIKHQYSADPREWMEIAHPDKKLVSVFLLLGFERLDGTGPRIDVNEFLRAAGWTLPKLHPVGTKVDYKLTEDFGDERVSFGTSRYLAAEVSDHVEGWYELTFVADGSKVIARPSHVFHEDDDK